MSISAQIRIRRDTAANFTSANPTLALGEIAYETDTFRFKVGTGSTAWNSLGYAAQNPTSLTVTDSTAATSTTTGALQVTGGISTQGALHTGADAVINGARVGIGPSGSATQNFVAGVNAGINQTASSLGNTFVGFEAGKSNTSAQSNTGIGWRSLTSATSGKNTAVGYGANTTGGSNNTSIGAFAHASGGGSRNTIVGCDAQGVGGTTSFVVGVGDYALRTNRANDVVAVGCEALDANTLGTQNVAVGRSALGAATTSLNTGTSSGTITVAGTGGSDGVYTLQTLVRQSGATFVTAPVATITVASGAVTQVDITSGGAGFSATSGCEFSVSNANIPAAFRFDGTAYTTAGSNTAVGHNAGLLLTTGSSVTAMGTGALDACTTGARNIGIGTNAWGGLTTGSDNLQISVTASPGTTAATTGNANVIVGNTNAGITSGSRNTIIGAGQIVSQNGPGATLTTGNRNIIIGNGDVATAGTNDSIYIGANNGNVANDGSGTTVIGTTSTTQARIRGATFLSTGANGQSTQLGQSTTLLSGLSGATVTATNLIPANCILLGVTARVTTAITGATTFDIGDGTTANRFGDDIAIALDTTANNCIAPALFTAANNVVLTANGSNFTGGAVRLTAHFMTLVAPTS